MVWTLKRVCVVVVSCCVMLLAYTTDTLAAYTPYEGNISTTYITIFDDIQNNISIKDDYVFLRSGQYDYVMLVGDLTLDSNKITSTEDVTEYKITTNSGYSSTYIYSCTTVAPVTVNLNENLIYTNLGNYPSFEEKGEVIEYATLLAFVIFGICCLLRPIFKFVYRSRNGN